MSCVKFFPYNYADLSETTITASTEDALFPSSNLKDARGTKVWRSTSTSANLIYDLKTIESVTSVLVRGNTLDIPGLDASVTIEANGTSDFTSPAFSTTLTFEHKYNIGYASFAAQTYRFWRISFTGNPFVEIANVFIGQETDLTDNDIALNWRYKRGDRSTSTRNRYGQRFFDKINDIRSLRMRYALLNKSEFAVVDDMFNYSGKTNPVWVVVDDTETIVDDHERFSGMYRFLDRPEFSNTSFQLYNASFSLEEVT